MKENIYLHYAHCTKFTPGQLDRYPFSAYEMREMLASIESVWSEEDGNEWRICLDGRMLACEKDINKALAMAEYNLMNESREIQSKQVILATR